MGINTVLFYHVQLVRKVLKFYGFLYQVPPLYNRFEWPYIRYQILQAALFIRGFVIRGFIFVSEISLFAGFSTIMRGISYRLLHLNSFLAITVHPCYPRFFYSRNFPRTYPEKNEGSLKVQGGQLFLSTGQIAPFQVPRGPDFSQKG